MIPLKIFIWKVNCHYQLGDQVTELNHLLLMDNLRLFSKTHSQTDSLVRTVQMYSKDIGMGLGN